MVSAGVPYTDEMDQALMDEVVLYNPFLKEHSWPGLKKKLDSHPSLSLRLPKSLRDRTLLLIERRKTKLRQYAQGSGIVVPEPTDIEVAVDEAISLKQEAEKEENPKAALMAADKKITDAAEGVIPRPLALEDESPKRKPMNSCTEADPSKVSPTQRRRIQGSADLLQILQMKAEADEKAKEREREERLTLQKEQEARRREDEERWRQMEEERYKREEERRRRFEEQQEKREAEREKRYLEEREILREERERLRAAALVEAQMRREEMELMRRDLALREASAVEERKERNLLLKVLADQLAKK